MQELMWIDHLPENSLEGGIALANQLYWDLYVFKSRDNNWYAKSGEALIFKTNSREALDAFLYGLGLAYSVLPEPVFDHLRDEVGKWVE